MQTDLSSKLLAQTFLNMLLRFSVATYSRQMHEKRKPALLGKHWYSSVAIRYKVAGYVEEIVVKIYLRSRVGSSGLWDSIRKKPRFCCLHRSPCEGKVIQRIVEQKNVRCPAFISKMWAKFRFKRIFGRLVRDPHAMRARVNWSVLDYLPMTHFELCPTSSAIKLRTFGYDVSVQASDRASERRPYRLWGRERGVSR